MAAFHYYLGPYVVYTIGDQRCFAGPDVEMGSLDLGTAELDAGFGDADSAGLGLFWCREPLPIGQLHRHLVAFASGVWTVPDRARPRLEGWQLCLR